MTRVQVSRVREKSCVLHTSLDSAKPNCGALYHIFFAHNFQKNRRTKLNFIPLLIAKDYAEK